MSRNLDIAFTAWGALDAGLLTGKYNDDPTGGGGRIHSAGWGTLEEHKLAIATGGRKSWLGDIVERIDDHRNTVV